jgi:hypothetical protein
MLRLRVAAIYFLFLLPSTTVSAQETADVDVCIYGATSAGIIAAYTAKQSGKTVIVVDAGNHIGGLTTGGLGYTDIGNKYAVRGLGLDFYRRIGKKYGKFESWIFEPHVASEVFIEYIRAGNFKITLNHQLTSVTNTNGSISKIELQNNSSEKSRLVVKAKMYIDCSYEGDLMAKARVSYMVGREPNSLYHETYNGVQLRDKHQFPDGIDPYKIPGNPESGLLWGISPQQLAENGSGDKKVQSYNYRICLSSDPANSIPISRPRDYDSSRYELLLRILEKKPARDLNAFLKVDLMPNHKTDINNNGAFSTDMIGVNYNYPEANPAERKKIAGAHESYIRGLLYFIGHDPRMPAHLRKEMLRWGYPKDEYKDNGNWTPQMYVREARRMIGSYVMTQANCEGRAKVDDGIAMAAYTMDSHNCQRIVVNGMVKNEGDVQVGGFGPYPVAYRSIVPRESQCRNLLVPVCLSATHIAYGSIRMEPVFMVLGQSAATAAVAAIDGGVPVQQVDIRKLQQSLKDNPLADGSEPEIIVDNTDTGKFSITGKWHVKEHLGFGPSVLIADSVNSGESRVAFTPDIPEVGVYTVYSYFLPSLQGQANATKIKVFDGTNEKEVQIRLADVKVQGQTSGEWVPLGKYNLTAGRKATVTIYGGATGGQVVADAILLVPEK